MSFLQPAATILVLLLAWQMMAEPGRGITTGTFVAFHAAMFALLGGVRSIVATGLDLLHLKPLWERAKPILETLPEGGAERRKRHEPQGVIRLEGVRFAYPEGGDVLHGIDLEIRKGEFVALVGPSGSGKSTFDPAPARLRGCARGTHPLRRRGPIDTPSPLPAPPSRHRAAGRTPLAGDLYTNIVGAAHLPVEAAWDAARAAGLAEDIEAMPMGMYTMVSEGLSTLSGGQRQRVLIARGARGVAVDPASRRGDERARQRVAGSRAGWHWPGSRRRAADRAPLEHGARRGSHCGPRPGRIVQEGTFPQLAARRASSRSCWPGRPELVLLVARVGGGDLRGGLPCRAWRCTVISPSSRPGRWRCSRLARDDDRAHLLHFLAAGDTVELLVGELAFLATGFASFLDMLVS
jgi:hypothetical protein